MFKDHKQALAAYKDIKKRMGDNPKKVWIGNRTWDLTDVTLRCCIQWGKDPIDEITYVRSHGGLEVKQVRRHKY